MYSILLSKTQYINTVIKYTISAHNLAMFRPSSGQYRTFSFSRYNQASNQWDPIFIYKVKKLKLAVVKQFKKRGVEVEEHKLPHQILRLNNHKSCIVKTRCATYYGFSCAQAGEFFVLVISS
jgi:hypothetical protein